MGRQRGYKAPTDRRITCPICQKVCDDKSGLSGHVWGEHGIRTGNVDEWLSAFSLDPAITPTEGQPVVAIPPGSSPGIKSLQEEVTRMKLEREKMLLTGIPQPATPPDASSEAGLGSLTENVRETLQRRAFNAEQPSGSNYLKEMAENVRALKEITGTDQNKGNSGLFDTAVKFLALVGITGPDLGKFLFQRNTPGVISDGHFKIGDMTVPSGVMITPGLYEKMIAEQGAVERAKVEAASKVKMAETADRVFGYLAPLIADKFGTPTTARTGATTKSPATAETPTPGGVAEVVEEEAIFEAGCPSCGKRDSVTIPASRLGRAQEFLFTCEQCHFEDAWIYQPQKGAEPYLGPVNPQLVIEQICPECAARGVNKVIVASSLTPPGSLVECDEPRCRYSFTVTETMDSAKVKKGGGSSSRGSRVRELRQEVEEKELLVQLESLSAGETPVNEDEGGR